MLIVLSIFINNIFISANNKTYIKINPLSKTVAPGEKIPFVLGFIKEGKIQPQILPWDFKFSTSSGKFSGTVYTAPKNPGTYLIFVSYKKYLNIARITVKADKKIKKIRIKPKKVKIRPGQTFKFEAVVYDSSNKKIDFKTAWGSKGGNIDQYGNYKAGNKPGNYPVIAW